MKVRKCRFCKKALIGINSRKLYCNYKCAGKYKRWEKLSTYKLALKRRNRKKLIKNLDALVKKIVLLRDARCVVCGTKDFPTPGHLFSRIGYSTRWDLRNVFQQCANCNFNHERDPYPLTNYFIRKFGLTAYDKLHRKYVTPKKFTDNDLENLETELILILKKMELPIDNNKLSV